MIHAITIRLTQLLRRGRRDADAPPADTVTPKFSKQLDQVARVMDGWLGEGGFPVDPDQASMRASICMTCPMNRKESRFGRLKNFFSAALIQTLEVKNQMAIGIPKERRLDSCQICGCVLKLKVHVPLEFILEGMDEAQEAQFRKNHCWITKEKDRARELHRSS